jgi:hypothetical protein
VPSQTPIGDRPFISATSPKSTFSFPTCSLKSDERSGGQSDGASAKGPLQFVYRTSNTTWVLTARILQYYLFKYVYTDIAFKKHESETLHSQDTKIDIITKILLHGAPKRKILQE